MKPFNLIISFLALLAMIVLMRYQGQALVTSVSPHGILDLEFSKDAGRLLQLRLFLDNRSVVNNIYLDFLLIGSYAWFFLNACEWTIRKLDWKKWGQAGKAIALSAAFFDLCENFLMLLVWEGRFSASVMNLVFYIAWIKFILAGLVLLYLLAALFFLPRRKSID